MGFLNASLNRIYTFNSTKSLKHNMLGHFNSVFDILDRIRQDSLSDRIFEGSPAARTRAGCESLDKVHLQGLSVKGPSPCRKAVFALNSDHAVETWLVGTIHKRQDYQEDKRNDGKANR